jgi:MerR family transcriptional regulator, light-induced transcriptional regulator
MTMETPRHPMGVVVQRTGLTSHVLRAWERRYGAVSPGRTEGGQRLYSDADLVRLRLLRQATETGRPIGTVASLPTPELAALVGEDAASAARRTDVVGADTGGGVGEGAGGGEDLMRRRHLSAALAAAESMDVVALRAELMRAVVRLSGRAFVSDVVAPLLERVGELWERGALRPAQEHVVSTAVRHVLDWLLARYEASASAPLAVLGTPSGEHHEFGAMLAAVVAADAGWRVLYLGPSLPAEEIAMAAERGGASLVGVSMVAGPGVDVRWSRGEVERLRSLLPASTLLLIGGRASAEAEVAGVRRVVDLTSLGRFLSAELSSVGLAAGGGAGARDGGAR